MMKLVHRRSASFELSASYGVVSVLRSLWLTLKTTPKWFNVKEKQPMLARQADGGRSSPRKRPSEAVVWFTSQQVCPWHTRTGAVPC